MIKTSIYPNPVEKELFFKMEDVIFQNGELSLFDLQGKKINQFALNPKQENYNFDLSNQPNGIYLWQLRLDGKLRQQGKLVVMHEE
jgi:Secretion system C-terminal sorting domain